MPDRLKELGRFGLRGLRIAASTVALLELLRSHWISGGAAAGAWILFVLVEQRLPAKPVDSP